jgi:L,D-transpeptidase ErfK/SrfK
VSRRLVVLPMLVLLCLACATPRRPPFAPIGHELVRVGPDDTLIDLARTHDLGFGEMMAANPGVDPWVPPVGEDVVLPTTHLPPPGPQEGIVVNLASQRLWLFDPEAAPARSYPIGIGRAGQHTPIGTTKVRNKVEGPTWRPTASARREDPSLPAVVPPGPENPLGSHAIYLGWPRYLIHGTDEPYGVGRRVSRGCIRLYPEDIPQLYELTDVGLGVRVLNDPVLTGWIGTDLYLDVHPPVSQKTDEVQPAPELDAALEERLREAAGDAAPRIIWDAVRAALAQQTGIPRRITRRE